MSSKAYKAYQSTQVTTAKPEKILLMLYEGCIKYVKISRIKMKEKKISEKGKNISKALAIVSELMNTLDHEVGGQLSQDLENLYMFIMDKLIDANIHNKIEDLDIVEKLLTTLYEAWTDVVNYPRPDGVPSSRLQPELYTMYLNSREKNHLFPPKNFAFHQNTNKSGVSVHLSPEQKAKNFGTKGTSKISSK
jgi:flagellar protein FliS